MVQHSAYHIEIGIPGFHFHPWASKRRRRRIVTTTKVAPTLTSRGTSSGHERAAFKTMFACCGTNSELSGHMLLLNLHFNIKQQPKTTILLSPWCAEWNCAQYSNIMRSAILLLHSLMLQLPPFSIAILCFSCPFACFVMSSCYWWCSVLRYFLFIVCESLLSEFDVRTSILRKQFLVIRLS